MCYTLMQNTKHATLVTRKWRSSSRKPKDASKKSFSTHSRLHLLPQLKPLQWQQCQAQLTDFRAVLPIQTHLLTSKTLAMAGPDLSRAWRRMNSVVLMNDATQEDTVQCPCRVVRCALAKTVRELPRRLLTVTPLESLQRLQEDRAMAVSSQHSQLERLVCLPRHLHLRLHRIWATNLSGTAHPASLLTSLMRWHTLSSPNSQSLRGRLASMGPLRLMNRERGPRRPWRAMACHEVRRLRRNAILGRAYRRKVCRKITLLKGHHPRCRILMNNALTLRTMNMNLSFRMQVRLPLSRPSRPK